MMRPRLSSLRSYSSLPSAARTRSTTCGVTAMPPLANVRIGADQLEHGDLGGAERERGVGLELRRDAEPVRGAHHGGRAELQRQPHRHGVERQRQRLGQRNRAEILAAVVLRMPALDRDRLVLAHGIRRQPAFDRGEIDERLERRAGLALRRDRAVELAFGIILSADQRAHRAIRRQRHHGALADAGLRAVLGKLIDQRRLGRGLQASDRPRSRPRCPARRGRSGRRARP